MTILAFLLVTCPASAQTTCTRTGTAITCPDGRVGVFTGDAVLWPDGTRSTTSPEHPAPGIHIGRGVQVGPGVFVGTGRGSVPLDDPNSAYRRSCVVVDAVTYC